ncbi:uncharacterized protein METZ01_LOCUS424995 [marine metagenome]|uniref:Uncharacterized protein n=1 Tax=marine metagenome TaxID=408172 RepID=A0A382XP01_9ZZZZ
MTLYAKIHKAIHAETLERMTAEMTRSVAKRAEDREHIWFKDRVVDNMVRNVMDSDLGDTDINDCQMIFYRFIEGTLQAMGHKMLDRYLGHGKEDN